MRSIIYLSLTQDKSHTTHIPACSTPRHPLCQLAQEGIQLAAVVSPPHLSHWFTGFSQYALLLTIT